jgi:CARDB
MMVFLIPCALGAACGGPEVQEQGNHTPAVVEHTPTSPPVVGDTPTYPSAVGNTPTAVAVTTTLPSSSSPLPDLSVATIERLQVEGQPIMAGKEMVLNVYVKNTGNAPSGPYHVLIFITDVTRGATHPHGNHALRSMSPGEQYAVYSTTTAVNCPGQLEVHVTITLDTQVDANTQNNAQVQPFTAFGNPC